jgi:hypothetical protein
MAKYRRNIPIKQESYKYPTRFGSHSSMIDEEKTGKLNDGQRVVLEDEHGYYTTERKKLDSGSADPNRYKGDRLNFYKN